MLIKLTGLKVHLLAELGHPLSILGTIADHFCDLPLQLNSGNVKLKCPINRIFKFAFKVINVAHDCEYKLQPTQNCCNIRAVKGMAFPP